MLEALKQQVYQANMELPRRGLVTYTWGNVSGIDRAQGLVVIKPSGVEYDALTPDDLVVLDLDGRIVEGKLPRIPGRTWSCTAPSLHWAALCTPTARTRWAGRRRSAIFPALAPRTLIIFMARFPVPDS